MENEERAQLEAQHQKEADNLKKEVARLTSLLEQALRDKSGKATVDRTYACKSLQSTEYGGKWVVI